VNTGPFTEGSSEQHELYESSSNESFTEIITSEEEVQFSSSDKDEARVLTMLEGVYCCNPALFSSDYADPVERHSLLLLDKNLLDKDESAGLSQL